MKVTTRPTNIKSNCKICKNEFLKRNGMSAYCSFICRKQGEKNSYIKCKNKKKLIKKNEENI